MFCGQFLLPWRQVIDLGSVCSYILTPTTGVLPVVMMSTRKTQLIQSYSHNRSPPCGYDVNTEDTVWSHMTRTQNSHALFSENKLPKWPQQQLCGFRIQTDREPYKITLSVCAIKRGCRRPNNASAWLISVWSSTSSPEIFVALLSSSRRMLVK
jgi:hypothetical protein